MNLIPVLLLALLALQTSVDSFRVKFSARPMGRFTKPISSDKCKSARSNSIATHCRTGAATSTSTHSRSTALSFKISEDDKLGITASSGRGAVLLGEPGDDDEEDDDEGDGDDDDDEGGDGSLLRKLSRGVVPLAASLGFTAVPSSRLALRLAGAAAGGVVGAVIRSVIRKRIRERELRLQGQFGQKRKLQIDARVQKALDRMMQDPNVIDMELQTMESIAKDAKVPEDLLTELFTRLFAEVVYDAVVNSEQQVPTATGLELTELSSVRDFAVDIGLSVHEIGCGFSLAALKLARQLKKDESGFYSADFPMELPYQAAKLFFLGDKMIGKSDGFYGKRLHSCLSFFVHDDYRKIVTSACTNIFRRYIEGVFLSPEDYSTDLTASLKEFLATSSGEISTLRAADMQNMVLEAIQFSLDRSLPDDVAPLDMRVENIQVLRKAQQVLGWDARELAATVELRTAPKYLQAVRDLLERVQSDPSSADGLAHVLEERAAAFGLARSKARDIVLEVISEKNAEYMDRINNIYEASGKQIGPTYKIMVKYAHTHAAFQKLAAGLTSEVKEIPIPGLPFVQGIRASMYQLQLDKGLGDGRGVSPEMFELREDQRAIVERQLVLPKVSSWVAQCITEGTFNDDAKQAYRKLLGQYGVDEEEWKASAVDFYYQECSRIAKSRQIPTSDDMQRLAAVKAFLDCDDAAVDRVNLELLGDKYVKALTEAMTPTGIITPEYAEGLERLRLRLGLTEENAQKLLSFSIQSRVAPAVQSLIDVWKSDTDAKYRREKEQREAQEAAQKQGSVRDKSRDNIDSLDSVFGYMEVGAQKEGGGPNVFMRDCLNVVDIVMENCGMQNVTDLESLPVNAAELAPPGDLAGVYKHFLITRLAERDEGLRARYLSYEPMFAKILGIDESNQRRVKRSLAYTSYKNMLKSILRVKPQVEATDIQQFFILKDFLPLEEDVAEKIRMDATKNAVMEHAEVLFGGAEGRAPDMRLITPASTRTLREQMESLDLSISEDAGFTPELLTFMYALEVQGLLESGEGEEVLAEIKELSADVYDIPEERAEEIIQSSTARFLDQVLNLALSEAKNYKEQAAMAHIKQMIKNAAFVAGAITCDGNMFAEEDKERLISFYLTELDSGEDQELVELTQRYGNMEKKFREMIQLSSEYEGPEYGLDGLMGQVGDLQALQREKLAKMAAGEKEWTWN